MRLRLLTIVALIVFKNCFEELEADECVDIAVEVLPSLHMYVVKDLGPDALD